VSAFSSIGDPPGFLANFTDLLSLGTLTEDFENLEIVEGSPMANIGTILAPYVCWLKAVKILFFKLSVTKTSWPAAPAKSKPLC